MPTDPKYTLSDFTPDEAKLLTTDIDAALAKYNAQFIVTPIINQNGTIGAKVELFKKVELVPKSVESPYANPEETTDAAPEESSEGNSAEPTQG